MNTQTCILYCTENPKSDNGFLWNCIYKPVSEVTVCRFCVCDQNDVRMNCNKIRGDKLVHWACDPHLQTCNEISFLYVLFPFHLQLTTVITRLFFLIYILLKLQSDHEHNIVWHVTYVPIILSLNKPSV